MTLITTYYAAEVGYLPAPGLLIAAGLKGYDNDNDGETQHVQICNYIK